MARAVSDTWLSEARAWLEAHEAEVAANADPSEPAHARMGPSSAARWLRCPGSVQMGDRAEPERPSEFAAEGTVAHHVRECCLAFGFEPEDFLGEEIEADGFRFVVDEEMVEALRPGIEWVRERPGLLVNEYRVRYDKWVPGQFGTLDVGIVSPDLIIINDLKYGQGVPVEVERNEQLMTYALAFWDNVARHITKATDFLLVIDQPRVSGAGGEWYCTLDDLLAHGERLKRGYEEVHAENPRLAAGEKQCRFCRAKGFCPELARWSSAQADLILDDLDGDEELTLADADAMTPERRAYVAKNYGLIKLWLDGVKAKVLEDALHGKPTPGVKAVEGRRGNRSWKDPEAAEAYLGMFVEAERLRSKPALLSPAQVEKFLPPSVRPDLEDFVTRPEAKPSLVPSDDPAPALVLTDILDDLD